MASKTTWGKVGGEPAIMPARLNNPVSHLTSPLCVCGGLFSFFPWHLIRIALEKLIHEHGNAGQEDGIFLEVDLAIFVVVQVAQQPLQSGVILLFLREEDLERGRLSVP